MSTASVPQRIVLLDAETLGPDVRLRPPAFAHTFEIHQATAVVITLCHIICTRFPVPDMAAQVWHALGDLRYFTGEGMNRAVLCRM